MNGVERHMNRRSFLAAVLATPALAAVLAACGDPSTAPLDTAPPSTTPLDTAPPPTVGRPTGADDVVLRIGYEGGLVTPQMAFVRTLSLLIAGDGRAIVSTAVPAIYPGPLLPVLNVRTIDPIGVGAVLRAAQAAGLLTPPPDYHLPEGVGVADASDTVVEIHANGTSFVHRANALDITGIGTTPDRERLSKFVAAMSDLATAAGADHLGAQVPFVATRYRLQARPVDTGQYPQEPKPTVVPWPADTGIALADAVPKDMTSCTTVDAAKVGTLFTTANQLTFFSDAGVTYQLAVIQGLPGDAGC